MKPQVLIEVARGLVDSNRGKPKQAFLRRAVSTTYYSLFHTLARCGADMFIGMSGHAKSKAWGQVYRSLDHGFAKNQFMDQGRMKLFPQQIQDFGNAFVTLQAKRHKADYDPHERFRKSAVSFDIDQAETAISDFCSLPQPDRRAFAAYVLFRNRP